ncbi:sugar nucleotide-binding protein [uncultured Oxalicibacterium sp.]|uniref:sugar nucleotide-binding protein n=1 Tax=uncultured Oxalicibacterium sp. TaxID=1168540 RepID=UPI0025F89E9E|nr:sugar nucleotide-binding protein [uncultured Oxalicibacterium sp.]
MQIQNNPAVRQSGKLGKPRLLIIGCGDVGMRMLPLLRERYRVFAVTTQAERAVALRASGAIPILADLDQPHTLRRLARLAPTVLHLAPPPAEGRIDRRTRNLTAILPERTTLVYVSTSGVYGDCSGALVHETRPVKPKNARAIRRVDAETSLRSWARRSKSRLAIVRVPGIYASDRLPIERLQKGTPALIDADDVFTNHIHADDLARIVIAAMRRMQPLRIYHAVDDSDMKMAAYFDAVADAMGLPRPPRLPRAELQHHVTPAMLSFMAESRRLSNQRLKNELGVCLQFPTVAAGVAAIR